MATTRLYLLSVIPAAITLNVMIGVIVNLMRLPVYLDALGTVLSVLLLYPFGRPALWSGILVGVSSFIIAGAIFNPVLFYFITTQAVIAAYTYFVFARVMYRYEQSPARTQIVTALLCGVGLGLVCAVANAPIVAFVFGGVTGSGPSLIAALFLKAGQSVWQATMSFGLTSEPIDKALQCLIAYLVFSRLRAGGLRLGKPQ